MNANQSVRSSLAKAAYEQIFAISKEKLGRVVNLDQYELADGISLATDNALEMTAAEFDNGVIKNVSAVGSEMKFDIKLIVREISHYSRVPRNKGIRITYV